MRIQRIGQLYRNADRFARVTRVKLDINRPHQRFGCETFS